MRTLTRRELTAALAARQLLLERRKLSPSEAIRRLTLPCARTRPPARARGPPGGLPPQAAERALRSRRVVKTTVMRMTLHLVAGTDYPAYAQLARQGRMRTWRNTYEHLDE